MEILILAGLLATSEILAMTPLKSNSNLGMAKNVIVGLVKLIKKK
jgi:hypothetical protein